jgi:tRNA pseudouridine38-40 synthase
VLEDAAMALTGTSHRLDFAGRTDAGVHATGQVAALTTTSFLVPDRWLHGLNRFLPPAVAVQSARCVPLGFDPRHDAASRTYHYLLRHSPVRQPLWESRAWVIKDPLDIGAMASALALLPGTRDFASFASRPQTGHSVRTLLRARIDPEPKGWDPPGWRIRLAGNAFLPHQVRRTVGQIVEIGRGRQPPERIAELLASPQFGAAGPGAPPQGLYLTGVRYTLAELADWNDDDEDPCDSRE